MMFIPRVRKTSYLAPTLKHEIQSWTDIRTLTRMVPRRNSIYSDPRKY